MSVTRTTSLPPNGYVSSDKTSQVKLIPDPAAVQARNDERECFISLIMREKGVTKEVAAAEHDFFN